MAISTINKAIFLDKDGTLIENVPYNIDPEKIRWYEGVPDALRQFKQQGYLLVIVTNQPGVAYGYFKEHQLENLKVGFHQLFNEMGIVLDGFYYCPHHGQGMVKEYSFDCSCRKPLPGMILQAARAMNIDVSASWMIGDILHDVEAGNRAGCKTILINNGNETEWEFNKLRTPTHTVWNMKEAAEKIEWEEKNNEGEKGESYEGAIEKPDHQF